MEARTIDCCGMACPIPVINTKKALEGMIDGRIITIVDNEAAKENVLALANSMGCSVEVDKKGELFHITILKNEPGPKHEIGSEQENTVILIKSSEFGRGSEKLGSILMKSFMFTLVESDNPPVTMLFVNGGVRLTCEGSAVIEHIHALYEKGVEILSCGTCLDYFNLKEKLLVGKVTNMYTIYEKMNSASKVISL